jgi:glyoxylase-like metal-dependent hydrolase (beta-lactamase superfamily II)
MTIGSWNLTTVSGGRFSLDGGTMFGIVPKPVWERSVPADANNRITLATNCVLLRDGARTLLIDTGYGGKATPKERDLMQLSLGEPLVESLAALGVPPDQIDLVIFSHLHFDHAGGATRRDDAGGVVPVFPRAGFVVQKSEWEDALSGAPELKGAYPSEHLRPLAESGRLELVEGDVEVAPGIRLRVTGGHTRGHQSLIIASGGQTALYPGDICPTSAHMPTLWGMAYDTFPLVSRRIKAELLGTAADHGWWILFDHDPDHAAAKIRRDDKREFAIVESIARM